MRSVLRKVTSILAVIVIVLSSVFAWYMIEIGYDGCCGAPQNDRNNLAQSAVHVGAYGAAALMGYAVIRWGFTK